jgi:hypothetical protein
MEGPEVRMFAHQIWCRPSCQTLARMSRSASNSLLLGLVAGSVLVGIYDAAFYWRGMEPARPLGALWQVVFAVLLVLWLENDSRGRPEIDRPFDFRFLAFIYWMPYLPYYLWRTRRAAGMLLLTGFLVLFFLRQLLMWGIYLGR